MYEYVAHIVRVVDGDTVHAEVDLGCDVQINLTIRLAGINAPELGTPEGPPAKAFLEELLAGVSTVVLHTVKDHREKYGRYLGFITAGNVAVNQAMIDGGHAVVYNP